MTAAAKYSDSSAAICEREDRARRSARRGKRGGGRWDASRRSPRRCRGGRAGRRLARPSGPDRGSRGRRGRSSVSRPRPSRGRRSSRRGSSSRGAARGEGASRRRGGRRDVEGVGASLSPRSDLFLGDLSGLGRARGRGGKKDDRGGGGRKTFHGASLANHPFQNPVTEEIRPSGASSKTFVPFPTASPPRAALHSASALPCETRTSPARESATPGMKICTASRLARSSGSPSVAL